MNTAGTLKILLVIFQLSTCVLATACTCPQGGNECRGDLVVHVLVLSETTSQPAKQCGYNFLSLDARYDVEAVSYTHLTLPTKA